MRIFSVYFSATLTTRKIVNAISGELAGLAGSGYEEIDITTPSLRHAFERRQDASEEGSLFLADDLVIFGSPVYIGRMPNLISPFYRTVRSGGARCVAVALFGNRAYDNGLIELCDILRGDGFDLVAAGAFVGEHSFSRILGKGRPDDEDIAIARDFARGVYRLLEDGYSDEPLEVPGEPFPYKFYNAVDSDSKKVDIRKVKPVLDESRCSRCGLCASVCPMGSVSSVEPLFIEGICIKCGACVKRCPHGALSFDDLGFTGHLMMLENSFAARRAEPELYFRTGK